jgi:uncharacterized protein YbaR (Trm112 family)
LQIAFASGDLQERNSVFPGKRSNANVVAQTLEVFMSDKAPKNGSADRSSEPLRIDPRLLEILVCPVTKKTLEYDAERQELISRAARLAYPIRDGIPIMLPEEARPLED